MNYLAHRFAALFALLGSSVGMALPPYFHDFIHPSSRIESPQADDNFKFGSQLATDGQRLAVRAGTSSYITARTYVLDKFDGQWVTIPVSASGASTIAIDGDVFVEGHENDERALVYVRDDAGTQTDPSDDSWTLLAELTASDGYDLQRFGSKVAVTSNWIAVTASNDHTACVEDPGCDAGAVYLYRHDDAGTPLVLWDDTWVQTQKLIPWADASIGSRFGQSIALQGDWLAVGAPNNRHLQGSGGAVFMFRRHDNGTPEIEDDFWSSFQRLIVDEFPGLADQVGTYVALDGNRLAVSAEASSSHPDTIYSFELNGTWSQTGTIYGVYYHTKPILQGDLLIALVRDDQILVSGVKAIEFWEWNVGSTPEEPLDDQWVRRRRLVSLPVTGDPAAALVGGELITSNPSDDKGCDFPVHCETGALYVYPVSSLLMESPAPPVLPAGDFVGIQKKNRYISFSPNPAYGGQPAAYFIRREGQDNEGWFVSLPLAVPGLRQGEAITSLVSDLMPIYLDSISVDLIHARGCRILPSNVYEVFASLDGVNFSQPLRVHTSLQPVNGAFWGDVCGYKEINDPSNSIPPTPLNYWRPPDFYMTGWDVVAVLEAYQQNSGALHITRADLAPATTDSVVNGMDILAAVNAFSVGTGREHYGFSSCPHPPSSVELLP